MKSLKPNSFKRHGMVYLINVLIFSGILVLIRSYWIMALPNAQAWQLHDKNTHWEIRKMATQQTPSTDGIKKRLFFIMPEKVSWWIWLITACLLAVGLAGFPYGFYLAVLLSILQTLVYWIQERRFSAFPVQLRIAYTLLLSVCLTFSILVRYWPTSRPCRKCSVTSWRAVA